MSVCEAYSTPIVQHDTGDVIQMTECAAYISHPAVINKSGMIIQ